MPLGQSFSIFRFMDPPTPNSLVLEKNKLEIKAKYFLFRLNYSLHMTKTHGKLKHDYITGSCAHGHDLFGGPTKENSYSL